MGYERCIDGVEGMAWFGVGGGGKKSSGCDNTVIVCCAVIDDSNERCSVSISKH